jgi:hypothetical protein
MAGGFLIYEKASGRIDRALTGSALAGDYSPETEAVLEADAYTGSEPWNRWFVVDHELALRPPMPVGRIGNTLTVPPGTQYLVRGPASAEGATKTGELELEFAEPGAYTVTLRNCPYLDAEVTLEG